MSSSLRRASGSSPDKVGQVKIAKPVGPVVDGRHPDVAALAEAPTLLDQPLEPPPWMQKRTGRFYTVA
jgi:hypothetical protein